MNRHCRVAARTMRSARFCGTFLCRIAIVVGLLGIAFLPSMAASDTVRSERRDIADVLTLRGEIEARQFVDVLVPGNGRQLLRWITAAGDRVAAGDIVARFADDTLQRQQSALANERRLAENERETLAKAQHPLELADLQQQINNARQRRGQVTLALAEAEQLASQSLVPKRERDEQAALLASIDEEINGLQQRYRLTRTTLHPLALERVDLKLAQIHHSIDETDAQLAAAQVTASVGGVVVHPSLPIAGRSRSARAGDELVAGQTLLRIINTDDLLLGAELPEAQASAVSLDQVALIHLVAAPQRSYRGTVESLGVVARSLAGQPTWQKFIPLKVTIDESDAALRPGMSAEVAIRRASAEQVVAVPRAALRWQGNEPWVLDANGKRIDVTLGVSDRFWSEVRDGLDAGHELQLP
ncbi:efflux RND transporter periplasmic adaptor subunit [Gammaproteobacteria bacterium]|nr:efflux RND transporter periplasmic adaptor subunit [Gammaproteobacteria bacterium]